VYEKNIPSDSKKYFKVKAKSREKYLRMGKFLLYFFKKVKIKNILDQI